MTNGLPVPWKPGEHVAIVGQTGSGKTYLVSTLARNYRRFVVVFLTKKDPEHGKYWSGYKLCSTADAINDQRETRFALRPKYDDQEREGRKLLESIWRQGGWTVIIDEQWYAEKTLGLKRPIERLLTQGRSQGISVVIGMQRPVDISRFGLSQATHVFSFVGDSRDAKTIGEATTAQLSPYITTLPRYHFAYWHQSRRLITTGDARHLGQILAKPASEPLTTEAEAATLRA